MLNNESYTKEVDWTQFEKYVQKGGVSDIVVISNKGVAEGVLTDSIAKEVFPDYTKETSAQARIMTQIPSADKLEENIDKWREAGSFKGNVKYEKGSDFGGFLWSLWPILLLIALWYFFMRRMSGGAGGGAGVLQDLFDPQTARIWLMRWSWSFSPVRMGTLTVNSPLFSMRP